MSTIFILIILAAAAGLFFWMKNRSPSKADPKTAKPATGPVKNANNAETDLKGIMDTLLSLNIMLRKDQEISEELRNRIETIIDDLKAVIPQMMTRYPGETLTYEMKKIGRTHLFKTVKEYLDMSPESRARQSDIFDQTLNALHDVAARSRDIVEKNETAEFKTMANFLAGKFS